MAAAALGTPPNPRARGRPGPAQVPACSHCYTPDARRSKARQCLGSVPRASDLAAAAEGLDRRRSGHGLCIVNFGLVPCLTKLYPTPGRRDGQGSMLGGACRPGPGAGRALPPFPDELVDKASVDERKRWRELWKRPTPCMAGSCSRPSSGKYGRGPTGGSARNSRRRQSISMGLVVELRVHPALAAVSWPAPSGLPESRVQGARPKPLPEELVTHTCIRICAACAHHGSISAASPEIRSGRQPHRYHSTSAPRPANSFTEASGDHQNQRAS